MGGNRIGGIKARDKNLARDPDWYRKLGAKGGAKSRGGGFAKDIPCDCNMIEGAHFKRNCGGKKGGTKSRRTFTKPKYTSIPTVTVMPTQSRFKRFFGA